MSAIHLTTTDATTTTFQAFAPRPVHVMQASGSGLVAIRLTITAQASDGTSAVYYLHGAAKVVGGTVSLVGTPNVIALEDTGASSWGVTIDATGGEVRVRVTGAAGQTIGWRVETAEVMGGHRGNVDWHA